MLASCFPFWRPSILLYLCIITWTYTTVKNRCFHHTQHVLHSDTRHQVDGDRVDSLKAVPT